MRDFDREFNRANWLFRIVFAFVVLFIVGTIIVSVTVGTLVYKEVRDNGLKNSIERVWEGPK